LQRFSTYVVSAQMELSGRLALVDLGDLDEPDSPDAVGRLRQQLAEVTQPLVILGGDNAATYCAMSALAGSQLPEWALVTFDAHFDVRDGSSNGSPVRQLIDEGLKGERLAQVGLMDFSNSGPYAARVGEYGSLVVPRTKLRGRAMSDVVNEVLDRVSFDGVPVYVDLDMDVGDRAVVPGCPAAAPGGLSADELREIARALGRDARVAALDLTEIDPALDLNEETVRLAATCLLEFATGVVERTDAAGSIRY
jgi:formiminoglutamase